MLLFSLFILFGIAGAFGKECGSEIVRKVNVKQITPEESRSEKFLSKLADKVNKNAPRMVDKETQLHKAIGRKGEFVYQYILVNYKASYFKSTDFVSIVKPDLLPGSCKQFNLAIRNGVSILYEYYGKDGKYIATITIRAKDCGY